MNWERLQAHLEMLGKADTDGVKIRCRYRSCTCGAKVLDGLDAEVAGLPRRCDIVDLDPLAEALTLFAGLSTFAVLELPDGIRIARRTQYAIRSATQSRPVIGAHQCGRAPPPSTAWRWRLPPSYAEHDDPPY